MSRNVPSLCIFAYLRLGSSQEFLAKAFFIILRQPVANLVTVFSNPTKLTSYLFIDNYSIFIGLEKIVTELATGFLRMMKSCNICIK